MRITCSFILIACFIVASSKSLCVAEDPTPSTALTSAQKAEVAMKFIEAELEPVDPSIKVPPFDEKLTIKQVDQYARALRGPAHQGVGVFKVIDVTGDGINDLVYSVDVNGRKFYDAIYVVTKISNRYYETMLSVSDVEDLNQIIVDIDHDGSYEFVLNHNMTFRNPNTCVPIAWSIHKWDSSRPGFTMVSAEYRSFFEKKLKELEIKLTDKYIKENTKGRAQCEALSVKVLKRNLALWSGEQVKKLEKTSGEDLENSGFEIDTTSDDVYALHYLNKKINSRK